MSDLITAYESFTLGDYMTAIRHFNLHLGNNPDDKEVIVSNGIAKLKYGHYENAVTDLEHSGI